MTPEEVRNLGKKRFTINTVNGMGMNYHNSISVFEGSYRREPLMCGINSSVTKAESLGLSPVVCAAYRAAILGGELLAEKVLLLFLC